MVCNTIGEFYWPVRAPFAHVSAAAVRRDEGMRVEARRAPIVSLRWGGETGCGP